MYIYMYMYYCFPKQCNLNRTLLLIWAIHINTADNTMNTTYLYIQVYTNSDHLISVLTYTGTCSVIMFFILDMSNYYIHLYKTYLYYCWLRWVAASKEGIKVKINIVHTMIWSDFSFLFNPSTTNNKSNSYTDTNKCTCTGNKSNRKYSNYKRNQRTVY